VTTRTPIERATVGLVAALVGAIGLSLPLVAVAQEKEAAAEESGDTGESKEKK